MAAEVNVLASTAGRAGGVGGSVTGGSGLRALKPLQPANVEMSVLYVDRAIGALRDDAAGGTRPRSARSR